MTRTQLGGSAHAQRRVEGEQLAQTLFVQLLAVADHQASALVVISRGLQSHRGLRRRQHHRAGQLLCVLL